MPGVNHFTRLSSALPMGEGVVFLVGAGVSINSPACLPSGWTFLKALINGVAPTGDIRDKILELCTEPWNRKTKQALSKHNLLDILRFEQVIGIVAESVDPYLNILRIFDASNRPNENHQLLASLAEEGHYIFTTNFDGLLETALSSTRLRSVVTARDYSLARSDKIAPDKAVFKLHGSWRDRNGRLRSDSIQATVERVAKKEIHGNLVSPAIAFFREVLRKRHLVIVGYSGWDDFDIVEALLTTDSDKMLVWVDHSQHDGVTATTAEELFDELDNDWSRPRSKAALNIVRMLQNGTRKPKNLMLMEASTTAYLRSMIAKAHVRPTEIHKYDKQIHPDEFVRRWKFQVAPYKAQHWYLCGKFFNRMGRWDSAATCFRKAVVMARGNFSLKSTEKASLSMLAAIDCDMGRTRKAERVLRRLLPYHAATGNTTEYCDTLHSIAVCAYSYGDDASAFSLAKQALRYARKHNYAYGIASISNFVGGIHATYARFSAAQACFEDALLISRRLGDLRGLAAVLTNLGDLLVSDKRYLQASWKLLEALDYYRKLNDYQGQSITLSKFGMLYHAAGAAQRAQSVFREQLRIDEIRGDLIGQTLAHLNLALVADDTKSALSELNKAETIGMKLDDKRLESRILKGRGRAFMEAGKWSEGAICFRKSLRLQKRIGYDPDGLFTFFHLAECLQKLNRKEDVLRLMDTAFSEAKSRRQNVVGWLFRLRKALILKEQGRLQECIELLRRCHRSARCRGDTEMSCQSDLNMALIESADGRYMIARRRVLRQLDERLRAKDREQLGYCLHALGQVSEKEDYIDIAARSYLIEQFVWSDPFLDSHRENEEEAKANLARIRKLVTEGALQRLDQQKRRLCKAAEAERLANTVSPDWLPRCVVCAVRQFAARVPQARKRMKVRK